MDTITAIATPLGEGGIGVVRISGPNALRIADKVFKGKTKPSKASTHTIHYGKIIDSDTKTTLDEVLLLVMRKPNTYTREDMIEINAHGGTVGLKRILELILRNGARLAEPGEFTMRAFLSGRIDLAQAEAVLDIVQAKTDKSLSLALSQLNGELSSKIKEIKEKLVEINAHLEAEIDFPEYFDVEEQDINLKEVTKGIIELLKSGESGKLVREGATVPIIGRTNVGKSSLFNALISQNRAIVTPYPGTTRDTIEEWINLDGIPVKLVDTAGWSEAEIPTRRGIRKARNPIEKEGVQRTQKAIEEAFAVLFVFDQSDGLLEEDIKLLGEVKGKIVGARCSVPLHKAVRIIGVLNKCDLKPAPINWHNELSKNSPTPQLNKLISVSALKGDNIDSILPAISELISSNNTPPLVMRTRHLDSLRKANIAIERAISLVGAGFKPALPELISYEIREAINALGEITGEVTSEDILTRIFSEFCIGK